MNPDVIRIYTPITADLCIATPHAKVKGKNSFAPLPEGAAEVELIEDVEEMGGIVDPSYSLLANRKGHSEEGEISLTIELPNTKENPTKLMVLLGVDEKSLPIFGLSTEVDKRLVIGGTFGTETLTVLAGLARRGTGLRINGVHVDADDDKHFSSRMVERQFFHDGNYTAPPQEKKKGSPLVWVVGGVLVLLLIALLISSKNGQVTSPQV